MVWFKVCDRPAAGHHPGSISIFSRECSAKVVFDHLVKERSARRRILLEALGPGDRHSDGFVDVARQVQTGPASEVREVRRDRFPEQELTRSAGLDRGTLPAEKIA
jgi:hypothetical protein